jgi:hypothetical protein
MSQMQPCAPKRISAAPGPPGGGGWGCPPCQRWIGLHPAEVWGQIESLGGASVWSLVERVPTEGIRQSMPCIRGCVVGLPFVSGSLCCCVRLTQEWRQPLVSLLVHVAAPHSLEPVSVVVPNGADRCLFCFTLPFIVTHIGGQGHMMGMQPLTLNDRRFFVRCRFLSRIVVLVLPARLMSLGSVRVVVLTNVLMSCCFPGVATITVWWWTW